MKIGLDEWSIHHLEISAYEKLDLVERLGLEGIQFADARNLSPSLDHGEIKEIAAEAKRRNLYLEMGIPGLNIFRSSKALSAGNGDIMEGYKALLKASAVTGSKVVRTFVGGPGDRFRENSGWIIQLQSAKQIASSLGPLVRDLGVQLAFETHADVTSFELLRLIEEVGEDVARVCLDTGNFPSVLEDPLEATRRLAPYVIATHFKDGMVFMTDQGLCLQSRPVGSGILPVSEIIETLLSVNPEVNLSIEDHEGIITVDIFRKGWQNHFPDLRVDEFSSLIESARNCEKRIAANEMADPDTLEKIPWSEQFESRTRQSAAYLKHILKEAYIYE